MTWRELFSRFFRVIWAVLYKAAREYHAANCRRQHEHLGHCYSCRDKRIGKYGRMDTFNHYFTHCRYSTKEQRRNISANRKSIGLDPEGEGFYE